MKFRAQIIEETRTIKGEVFLTLKYGEKEIKVAMMENEYTGKLGDICKFDMKIDTTPFCEALKRGKEMILNGR